MTCRPRRCDDIGSEHDPGDGYALGGVLDLASGTLGTALRAVVRARDIDGWIRADRLLTTISRRAVDPKAGSLFRGAPALAYVLHTAGDRPPYRAARDRLDVITDTMTRERLRAATTRMDTGRPPRHREFDLVSGLTGLGGLLLHTGRSAELLGEVLAYLVRLLDVPVTVDGAERPGWWSTDTPRGHPDDPGGGHANLGLAHGVAGPLALLALCTRAGHQISDAPACLWRACELLLGRVNNDGHEPRPGRTGRTGGAARGVGIGWPGTIDAHAWTDPARVAPPERPSWCYGAPGLARALQLAAITCGHDDARTTAEHALADCASTAQLSRLGAGICHGRSGLRLALMRAYADAAPAGRLHGADLPHLNGYTDGRNLAAPGLLTGDDGVWLAGRTLQRHLPPPPRWDTCLLLDGPADPTGRPTP